VLRTERSRQAILDAFYELVGEGVLQPTANQVAERSGLGIRSVFRHFSEMDSLFAELSARLHDDFREFIEVEKPDGNVDQRAKALVVARCEMFERIAPYLRAVSLNRLRSDWLMQEHEAADGRLTGMVYFWLPEIERAPQSLRDAIKATLSFDYWERLRREQNLGALRTAAATELATMSLVAQLPR
jgi:AcrR family transcriptional regulator